MVGRLNASRFRTKKAHLKTHREAYDLKLFRYPHCHFVQSLAVNPLIYSLPYWFPPFPDQGSRDEKKVTPRQGKLPV